MGLQLFQKNPKNYKDMLSMCHRDDENEDEDNGYRYKKLKKHHKTKKEDEDEECYTSTGEEMIDEINSYYKDFNKGKSL